MQYTLVSLRVAALTNFEAENLISRHLIDFGKVVSAEWLTDNVLKTYFTGLTERNAAYKKALVKIMVTEDTAKVELYDSYRDVSVSNLRKGIKLGKSSEIAAESEAGRILWDVMKAYKKLEKLSYNAETSGINQLVADLESDRFKAYVKQLNLDRYVARCKQTNADFIALVGTRQDNNLAQDNYNAKLLRQELFTYYKEFSLYLQSLANVSAAEQYHKTLEVLNFVRKEFADILAQREGVKAASEKAEKAAAASAPKSE